MARAWVGTATLVLAVAGCGGSGENPRQVTREGAGHSEAAKVGGPPTVPPSPVEGVHARPPRPTVIASGQTARGDPFELVLYGTTEGTCISTMLPARRASDAGGACGESILPRLSSPIFASGAARFGRNEHEVEGFVSPDVDSVELSFELGGETQTLEAVTEQLPRGLLEKAGAKGPLGIFIAFLPEGVTAGDVTATAYDAGGSALGKTTWPLGD